MDLARLEGDVDETAANLDLTKEELYELAKEQDVDGRSKMTKDELAKAVHTAT